MRNMLILNTIKILKCDSKIMVEFRFLGSTLNLRLFKIRFFKAKFSMRRYFWKSTKEF